MGNVGDGTWNEKIVNWMGDVLEFVVKLLFVFFLFFLATAGYGVFMYTCLSMCINYGFPDPLPYIFIALGLSGVYAKYQEWHSKYKIVRRDEWDRLNLKSNP